jgi:MoaA/NifB/PqqE/SkfB family radical SAM enzyme
LDSRTWTTTILYGNEEITSLHPPTKKVLLWHITSKCNQSCKYCYGTFTGSSYRAKAKYIRDVPLEKMLETADSLAALGFHRAHICGGEPFLRKDIWDLLIRLNQNNIQTFVLTNATLIPPKFSHHFTSGIFTNLSFSLDSINKSYNDWVRGNSSIVISNIEKIVKMKRHYQVSTELGLYTVVTKRNINRLDELLDWGLTIGLDYMSFQLVYLPSYHPYYNDLAITSEDKDHLIPVFERLKNLHERIRVPGNTLFEMSYQFLLGRKLCARNCFCERDFCYLFLDGIGNVKRCPSKTGGIDHYLGNICYKRLTDIVPEDCQTDIICEELSPDCIGVWEMAHPAKS